MATLVSEAFLREPARSDVEVSPDHVPGGGETLDNVYSVTTQIDTLTVNLVNGSPYPPAVVGDLVDTTTEIVDAGDPTTTITFDAAGSPGTDSQLQFTQTANRDYGFSDAGTNANVITLEGAQAINGLKTFTETSFNVQSAGDPTITMAIDANGAPGTTATMTFGQTANRTYSLPDVPVNAELLLVEGNQSINGTKLFADSALRVVDAVDNTIAFEFRANGAAATTGTLQFNQTANRAYTFPNTGTNTDIVTLEGAQTISGNKSFPNNLQIFDAVDPTTRLRLDPTTGTATSTIRFNQTANRVYTVPNVAVGSTQIFITNAASTQTFSSTKTLTAGIFADVINERTLNNGTTVDGINFRTFNAAGSDIAQLTAEGAALDIDLIFRGASQITSSVPDGAVLGGNARGANSTDLQRDRTNPANVASGDESALLGGRNNQAAALRSVVFSGSENAITNVSSCIAGGENNGLGGNGSFILSGDTNQGVLGADNTFIMGGDNWNITADESFAGFSVNALADFSSSRTAILIANTGIASADDGFAGACTNINLAGPISGAFIGCGEDHTVNTGAVLCGNLCSSDTGQTIIICGDNNSITNNSFTAAIGGGAGNNIDNNSANTFITASDGCEIRNNSSQVFVGSSIDSDVALSDNGAMFSQGVGSSVDNTNAFCTFGGDSQVGIGGGGCNGIVTVGDVLVDNGADFVFAFGSTTVNGTALQGVALTADPGSTLAGSNILLSAEQYFLVADDAGAAVTFVDAIDDLAAAGAGVVVGEVYRTGSVLKVRVI